MHVYIDPYIWNGLVNVSVHGIEMRHSSLI